MLIPFVFLCLSIIPHADEASSEKVPLIFVCHQYSNKAEYLHTQYVFFEYGDVPGYPYRVKHWALQKEGRTYGLDTVNNIFYYYDDGSNGMKKVYYGQIRERHSMEDMEVDNREIYHPIGYSNKRFRGDGMYKFKTKYQKLLKESIP